jgi:hypothetical protein
MSAGKVCLKYYLLQTAVTNLMAGLPLKAEQLSTSMQSIIQETELCFRSVTV